MSKERAKGKSKEFDFLLEEVKRLGALEAKVVTSDKIAAEGRVLLKCETGCDSYGHQFVCPPFTPAPDEFGKMLEDYRNILIIKFPADAEADENVGRSLLRNQYDPNTSPDLQDRIKRFWDATITGGNQELQLNR
jgi:predicted metal-binding protein